MAADVTEALAGFGAYAEPRDGLGDNPFKLGCSLAASATDEEVRSAWPLAPPDELVQAWSVSRESRLFEDVDMASGALSCSRRPPLPSGPLSNGRCALRITGRTTWWPESSSATWSSWSWHPRRPETAEFLLRSRSMIGKSGTRPRRTWRGSWRGIGTGMVPSSGSRLADGTGDCGSCSRRPSP